MTAEIQGSWFPTGYYGHFRSKSRADFICEYRQLARPLPPKKFVVRSKEASRKHVFSHHDNRQAFLNDALIFQQAVIWMTSEVSLKPQLSNKANDSLSASLTTLPMTSQMHYEVNGSFIFYDETKKEELKDILSDDIEFKRIVENCSKDSGKSGEIEPTQSKKAKTDDQNVTPLPKSKKLMGNANTDEKRKDAKSQNGRAKKLKANPKVNLERAAEAQRLFELDTETDAIESLDPLLDADTVPATRDPQPVPPQEPETEHVPPQEPETEHVPPTETVSCSASVGEALNVLNPQPVPEPEHCHLNLHSPSLEQRVIWLESQLGLAWQSIYELQRTVSWLSQPGNQLQIPHTLSQNLTGSNGFVEENELDIGEQISPKENSPGQFGSTSDQVYNNYTKDQLWSYVQNAEEFGKASKLLFRKLFSEEEYRGRSLTGSAANKSTPARPALQDQRKLKVIHELIQKRWTWAKPAMVNGKISEILKPSRNSGQFRK